MNTRLLEFMRKMSPDSDPEQAEAIASTLNAVSIPAGTVLVRQGEIAGECYFILEGCLRLSFIDDLGNEKTVDFYTENQSLTIFESYKDGTPSPYSIDCIENALLIKGDMNSEKALNEQFPFLKDMTRNAMEQILSQNQNQYSSFKSQSPEDRYLSLLETRPGLAGRVPQYQLASYLGITPESLSRLKKRLYNKQ